MSQDKLSQEQVTPPKYPEWECRFKSVDREELLHWTVGDLQLLVCDGEPIQVLTSKTKIQFVKPDLAYTLKILSLKLSDAKQAQFVVTSYKPGDYKNVPLVITDGESGFRVKGLNWNVASVLKSKGVQAKTAQPPKMTRMGPFSIGIPMWYWVMWGAAITIVLAFFSRWIYKRLSRRRMLAKLESFQTALTPYNQYNKEARFLKRQIFSEKLHESEDVNQIKFYVRKLDLEFKMYLVRALKIPAQDWSIRDTLREIKSYHSDIDSELRSKIKRILFELERAQKSKWKVSREDWEQLTAMSQQVVDAIEATRRLKVKKVRS